MYTPSPVRTEVATLPLKPLLDERWQLSWRHVAACAWFCFLFLYFNYIPLFHSDLWGHVHYGKWMLEHRQLVDQDPFMPFAQGMHSANNAWLSQVIMAQLHAWGGPHYLSNLFAVVVVGAYLVHARTFYLLTGRLGLAVLGTVLLLLIGWSRHAIIRPEIFGNLSFAILLWLTVTGSDLPWSVRGKQSREDGESLESLGFAWRLWIGAPLLMFAWVNLHGSFAVGLVFLACNTVAVTIEEAWRTKSFLGLMQSRRFQRWAILLQLCVAATLINPYGLNMLLETWRFGKNPNLKDVLEWYPLKLIDMEGIQFGLSAVLLVVALRWSRLRISIADVLLYTVFLVAMAPTIRMIAWFAPVFLYLWMPHAADAWQRLERKARALLSQIDWSWLEGNAAQDGTNPDAANATEESGTPIAEPKLAAVSLESQDGTATDASAEASPLAGRASIRFAGTLACGLMVWTTFSFSPISQPILGGKTRTLERVHSRGTPLAATKYLREHPPTGVVFGPQWWGDWLAWDGPPGIQVFMTTHVHLAPNTVWKDYLRVARGLTGWSPTLERYAVETMVVDKTLQPTLADSVRGTEGWTIVFEDEQALIAQRKNGRTEAATDTSAEPAETAGGSETSPADTVAPDAKTDSPTPAAGAAASDRSSS